MLALRPDMPPLNPLSRSEMVIRTFTDFRPDFVGYWLSELVGALGEKFAWWISAAQITSIDGRDAVNINVLADWWAQKEKTDEYEYEGSDQRHFS